jgi:hypothetical protein
MASQHPAPRPSDKIHADPRRPVYNGLGHLLLGETPHYRQVWQDPATETPYTVTPTGGGDLAFYLTPCCWAPASRDDADTYCKRCYQPVDSICGGFPRLDAAAANQTAPRTTASNAPDGVRTNYAHIRRGDRIMVQPGWTMKDAENGMGLCPSPVTPPRRAYWAEVIRITRVSRTTTVVVGSVNDPRTLVSKAPATGVTRQVRAGETVRTR